VKLPLSDVRAALNSKCGTNTAPICSFAFVTTKYIFGSHIITRFLCPLQLEGPLGPIVSELLFTVVIWSAASHALTLVSSYWFLLVVRRFQVSFEGPVLKLGRLCTSCFYKPSRKNLSQLEDLEDHRSYIRNRRVHRSCFWTGK
jgi:hypothetical protein